LNFGKTIPNFMVYNDLQPICNPANRNFGLDQLWPVYAAINQARQFSAALAQFQPLLPQPARQRDPQPPFSPWRNTRRPTPRPNFSDVVFAFTTLDRNNTQTGSFDVNITQNGSNLFGIQPNRLYNVKNISAYTAADPNRRNYWLWGGTGGIAGSNVLANGIYVSPQPRADEQCRLDHRAL
jgi:archaellum component FlaF (FlaF/FlaG flagellin family)